MRFKTSDPLLTAANVIIILSQIAILFGGVMLAIGIGAVLTVGSDELAGEIAKSGAPTYTYWLIILAMVTGMALLFLANRFLNELRGIIETVGAGDPFQLENANRLSRMGWYSVIGHLLLIPVVVLAIWVAPFAKAAGETGVVTGKFDFGVILLTLILFILARVFRRGAEMREELEGTV